MAADRNMFRRCCRGPSPMFVILLAYALLVGVTLAFLVMAYRCPEFREDEFHRVSDTGTFICFLNEKDNQIRNGATVFVVTLIGLVSTSFVLLSSISAFSKFLRNGVGTAYARVLLGSPGQFRCVLELLRTAMFVETNARFVKTVVVILMFVIPVLGALLPTLSGTMYTSSAIRVVKQHVNITGAPDWVDIPTLQSTGWVSSSGADDLRSLDLGSGQQSRSLSTFATTDSPSKAGRGSGLQTMRAAYPPDTGERTMAVIPLKNILLDPVPSGTLDFAIEQDLLLVDQKCTYGGFRVPGSGVGRQLPGTYSEQTGKLSGNSSSGSGANYVPYLDEAYLKNLGWNDTDLQAFFQLNTTGSARNVWTRARYSKPESGFTAETVFADIYKPDTPMALKFKFTIDDSIATFYTLSPEGDSYESPFLTPMACRVNLIPIRQNVTLPAQTKTSSYLRQYKVIKFSAAAKQLVQSAFDLSSMAVDAMESCSYRLASAPLLGPSGQGNSSSRAISAPFTKAADGSCTLPPSVEGVYPLLPLTVKVCDQSNIQDGRFQNTNSTTIQPKSVDQDSCASTEFDKLMFAHLAWLSYLPSPLPSDASSGQWGWGPSAVRFHPRRHRILLLAGLVVIHIAMVIIHLLLTYVPEDDMIDIAPWSLTLTSGGKIHTNDRVRYECHNKVMLKKMKEDDNETVVVGQEGSVYVAIPREVAEELVKNAKRRKEQVGTGMESLVEGQEESVTLTMPSEVVNEIAKNVVT